MNTQEIKILLSSPGDLNEDREFVRNYIETHVNKVFAEFSPIRYRVVAWETDAVSGKDETAQDVIDKSLPSYDVYLGMLWTRIGTPVKGQPSGTAHEYEVSSEKLRGGELKRVMFFVREGAVEIASIDATQFFSLQQFKDKIKKDGVLIVPYKDRDSLKDLCLLQFAGLTRIINEGHDASLQPSDESKLEFMSENVANGEENLFKSASAMSKISDSMAESTQKIDGITARVLAIKNFRENERQRQIKKAMEDTADAIDSRSLELLRYSPTMLEYFSFGVENYAKALSIAYMPDGGREWFTNALESLDKLNANADKAKLVFSKLRETGLNYDNKNLHRANLINRIAIDSVLSSINSIQVLTRMLTNLIVNRLESN